MVLFIPFRLLFFKEFKKEINNSRSRAWGIGENRLFFRQALILQMSLPWDNKFPVVGKITVFHFCTGSGRLVLCRPFDFGGDFHSLLGGFFCVFRSRFVRCLCENQQKSPCLGADVEEVLRRWGARSPSPWPPSRDLD